MIFILQKAVRRLQAGFTLVESLVSVTILTLAVIGPMFTASRAIVAAQLSKDQMIASYLAQEGIEYIRAVRDDNYLAAFNAGTGTAWNDFKNAINQCRSNSCTLGPQSNGMLPLNTGPSTFSMVSNETSFSRTIQIIDASPSGDTDVQVVSKVTWNFHGITKTVSIRDHLTPWQ